MPRTTRPAWGWSYGESGELPTITFHCYCDDKEQADEIREELRSLGGAHIEQDGEFLYAVVCADEPGEVIAELEATGFDTFEDN